jgi:hypothetical protein
MNPSGMHLETINTSDNRSFNLPMVPETRNTAGELVENNVISDTTVQLGAQHWYQSPNHHQQRVKRYQYGKLGTFSGIPLVRRRTRTAGWIPGVDGIQVKNGICSEFTSPRSLRPSTV